eukprot:Hpha_TRINITY_DN15303_c0_g2::TRINITY_DN15303_c0_g2_i1::g.88443::m.88443
MAAALGHRRPSAALGHRQPSAALGHRQPSAAIRHRQQSETPGERRPHTLATFMQRPETEGGKRRSAARASTSSHRPPFERNGSLQGATADAAEQFKQLFAKQAFMKGAGTLVEERALRQSAAAAPSVEQKEQDTRPVLMKGHDGSWRPLKSRQHVSPPRVRNKLTAVRCVTPQAVLSEAGLLSAPTTRGHTPCLGRVTGAASPFGSLRREPLAALTVPLATGPTSRRALAALGPRAANVRLQQEREMDSKAAMQHLDAFSERHKELLSGSGSRQALALRGTAAAAMSLAFKGRAMRFGKFRETRYASLWKSLGPQGLRELYDARVGGGSYALTPVAFESMHEVFIQSDPGLWAEIVEEDPTVIVRFFKLVDVNGDQKVTYSEFAAAVALITMSGKAQRNLSIIFDSLDGNPPTGRLTNSSFTVSALYSTLLPRVPAAEDRQWRRALLGVHTIAEEHLKPQKSWGYDEFLERMFTHFRRPLDDEFGQLTIHRNVVREIGCSDLLTPTSRPERS